MSVKSFDPNHGGEVVRCGLLKKFKTSRKKWFVLRAETPESSARLEYYDSEKKFNNGLPPKRSIPLRTCFNINKRNDTKYKHVIALYTKDDCFCVVLESEEDLDAWLKDLLSLQHGEEAMDGETPRPTFEHVWQVTLLNRGLGTNRIGPYRLCLTDKTLTLIKKDENGVLDLQLTNIRSCGSLRNYFFLEVGRSSHLGAGELWMDSDDPNIAQNIHTTIFHAMTTNTKKEELEPRSRVRSSSATESSKPNNAVNRTRQGASGVQRTHVFSQGIMGGRERCDSMPSRPRTTSEGPHPITTWRFTTSHHRSHGRDISHSPPSGSPVSPPSVGCSTDSTGSSYSLADEVDVCTECPEPMRYSVPLTPDEAIAEEDCPESVTYLNSIYESYVPMAPPSSDDGYVDMSPRCPHNATSPTVSMSSVTSGTPSTDIRFSDYPLDKVSSYLASEDDDARPARAYSVGSRPETCRSKRHVELAGTPENSRVRAFSVGSKTKKGLIRVLPPHYPHAGAKSSSAPLLSNYRTHSSHSSIGPMDDLMEMDFSRSNTGSSTNSGYMEMKPGVAKTPSGYVEMKPGVDLRTNSTSNVSPYVDMSGSSPARNHITSPHEEYNSFVDMRQYHRLSSHEQARNNNYMDMDQRKHRTHSSSSNTRVSTSPSSYPWSDYMDMSGNQPKRSERGSFSSQLSSSPNVVSVSPKNGDYSPLNLYSQDLPKPAEKEAKTPDGYVEMTPGSVKHQRQSSLDSTQVNKGNEDYTNMSLGLGAAKKKVVAKKEKARSQPISINSTTASFQVTKNSSSPISVSSLLGRKSSTGTPPRMHLPISSWSTSPYSSLPRQKPRKDSNSNSKDSSSSSVTTPSSSSTIFPMSLNSPSSPMKPTSKAETPSGLKLPAALLNAIYKNNNKSSVGKPAADDYTVMDFETNKSKPVKMDDSPSDYVNYSPAAKTPIVIPSKVEVMDETPGDYALMKPGVVETRTMNLPLLNTSSSGNTSPLVNDLSSFGIDETQAKCFRPIKEDVRLGSSSPRPGDVVPTKLSEVLNFFPVPVEEECNANDGRRKGICMNTYECRIQGGKSYGFCALGFGVCCVFTATCDQEAFNNITYFVNPDFPDLTSGMSSCALTVKKIDPEIAQLRLDFIHFNLGQPNRKTGVCEDDVFLMSSGSYTKELTICGLNSGQHVYFDVENINEAVKISMKLSRRAVTRLWEVRVTQVPFTQRAPAGCLQYHEGVSGIIQTMNFADNGRHLADQEYNICMRQEEGMCSIAYEPCHENAFRISPNTEEGTGGAGDGGDTIGDPGSGDGDPSESRNMEICNDKIVLPCDSDDLILPGEDGPIPGFCDITHCGPTLCPSGEMPCRIESSAIPFVVGVHFGPSAREVSPEDNLGMCLTYEQLPCNV